MKLTHQKHTIGGMQISALFQLMQTKLCSGHSTANEAYFDGFPVTVTPAPSTHPAHAAHPEDSPSRAISRAARGTFLYADMPASEIDSSAGNGSDYGEGHLCERFSYR